MKTKKVLSILLALLMVVSIIPATAITSSAATIGYSTLSADETQMQIYFNPYEIEIPDSVYDVTIYNADLNEPLNFDNGNICNLTFVNCTLDMSEIGDFEELDMVSIMECHLEDLILISENTDITYLYLYGCHMGSLNGIQYLENLESLYIYELGVESIDLLRYNEKLKDLTLDNTCITDLSPIENLDLNFLSVSNTMSIRDLSPVMSQENLLSFNSDNCEMAYTTELYEFIETNNIENDMEEDWQEIQEAVQEVANELYTPYMSDIEIVEVTVDYVLDLMDYDMNILDNDDLALEYNIKALSYAIKGEGVCRNYSALTLVLLQEVGIPVYEISSIDHIWNIVMIDNEFYWLDTTWLDDMSKDDVLVSPFYMNNEYCFDEHDVFTVPFSMYDSDKEMGYIFEIYTPSKETIRYKDGIVLHTPFEHDQFDGTTVVWESYGDCFKMERNDDGSVTIISDKKGDETIIVNLIDEDGNIIASDYIEITSKASFFDKLGGFFRSIFGLTEVYEY